MKIKSGDLNLNNLIKFLHFSKQIIQSIIICYNSKLFNYIDYWHYDKNNMFNDVLNSFKFIN